MLNCQWDALILLLLLLLLFLHLQWGSVVLLWACVSLRLSVCEYISTTTPLNFTKFSFSVACDCGSVHLWQYIMYFQFCGSHYVFYSWHYSAMTWIQQLCCSVMHWLTPRSVVLVVLEDGAHDDFTSPSCKWFWGWSVQCIITLFSIVWTATTSLDIIVCYCR